MVFTGILIVFTGILICKTIRNIKRILGELYISKRILTTSHDKKSDGQNRYEIQTDVRDMFIILLVIVKCVCVYECVCVFAINGRAASIGSCFYLRLLWATVYWCKGVRSHAIGNQLTRGKPADEL